MTEDSQPPPTLTRLLALMKAGYQVDASASMSVGDTVWLEHASGRSSREPTLLLFEDGLVVGTDPLDSSRQQLRIPGDATEAFPAFLRSVPAPTWWDLNYRPFYLAIAWIFIIGFWAAIGMIIQWLWDSFVGP